MESAIKSLCFLRPRAITITSPVGGSEGGIGAVEGTGEDSAGDEGKDGGGGGQGHGEASGEGGDVIAQGERSAKSLLLRDLESHGLHLPLDSPFNISVRTEETKKKKERIFFRFEINRNICYYIFVTYCYIRTTVPNYL